MQILSSSNTEHLNATVKFRLFCRKLHNPLTSSNGMWESAISILSWKMNAYGRSMTYQSQGIIP